jgi:predicted nucleic acid-binding protein
VARYLADTSAWHWSPGAESRWRTLLELGEVALCSPVLLELLYSARDRADYRRWARDLGRLPSFPLDARADSTAARTQADLADRGEHRGPTPVDLLIAAVAEVNRVVLLHYDRHFEAIADVTGQPMEWLAPRGSLR